MIDPFGTPKSDHQPHHQSNSPDLFKILESRDLQKTKPKMMGFQEYSEDFSKLSSKTTWII
jgi:hypothetical protein